MKREERRKRKEKKGSALSELEFSLVKFSRNTGSVAPVPLALMQPPLVIKPVGLIFIKNGNEGPDHESRLVQASEPGLN